MANYSADDLCKNQIRGQPTPFQYPSLRNNICLIQYSGDTSFILSILANCWLLVILHIETTGTLLHWIVHHCPPSESL